MKIEELQKEYDKLDKEEEKKKKEIKKGKEYITLEKEINLLVEKEDKLEEEETELKRNINYNYTDNGHRANYSKPWVKNIRPEVLNSIKRVLGIRNISLLTGRQVEKITNELIDKDLEELYESEEYKKIEEKIKEIEIRLEKIKEKQEKMLIPAEEIGDKAREIERKIYDIKKREMSLKNIKDKKKLKKEREKEKKKEEIRDIVDNKLHEIINPLQLAITKEKVLNNLDGENDNRN